MDTKSKKWKSMVSFCAFFLSVSFMLGSAAALCDRCYRNGGTAEVFEEDFQNTASFRNYISNRFFRFLAMAEELPLYSYDYYQNYYDYYYDYYGIDSIIEQEAVAIPGDLLETEDKEWQYGAKYGGDEYRKSDRDYKKEAEEYHKLIAKDKNLLYRISYEGKTLYTNLEDGTWNAAKEALPDGYNFLLYFDGEKASVFKDGAELDIYGDGYYTEDSDWFLPGYFNFTQDDEIKKVEIAILAAERPSLYSHVVKSNRNGYIQSESPLYYMANAQSKNYSAARTEVTLLIAGAALFVLYLILRKSKKTVDVWIGKRLNKVWVEGRLLLLFLILSGVFTNYFSGFQEYYGDVFAELVYAYDGFEGAAWYVGEEFVSELMHWLTMRPSVLLILFWLLYLLVVDIWQNRGDFWNGLVRRMANGFETKSMKLPLAKRMVCRFTPVFWSGLLLGAAEFAIAFLLRNRWLAAYWQVLLVICGGALLAVFLWLSWRYLLKVREQAAELERLTGFIAAVHDGDYSGAEETAAYSEFKEAADNLKEIRSGMEQAVEERMKSERMKVELVANVSHDIKTPLTSIISYVEFLKQEDNLPQHVKDYICILDEKSERLKNMVQDVFAISKAASGQLAMEVKELDFGKLLRQTLADMSERIDESPVTIKTVIPEEPVFIRADGQRMYRVFQNLILNALKYSLEGSRIYITLKTEEGTASAGIQNTSRKELKEGFDFTERFVRGDESRTDGGSGLGLSIAKSFTEACGGTFEIELIADLFVVKVSFPCL